MSVASRMGQDGPGVLSLFGTTVAH